MLRGIENSFSSLGWLVGQRAARVRRGQHGTGVRWAGYTSVPLPCRAIPVFQQKGPQHIGSVLCLDLVRDDHLLHHLVGHPRQGLLVQVQEHSP
jgi:hypothetical protein